MRLLTFTTLYPSAKRPTHGIFVETRLRQLIASGTVESKVIAPVPWFPSTHPRFGDYATMAAVPKTEERHGIHITHPRYFVLPKIGMTSAPFTLARAGLAAAQGMIADGYDFDAIDAHYFYPDGVAAVKIGEALRKPVVITARGTDINLIPQYRVPRRMIVAAARRCAAIVTVCGALKDGLVALGADGDKIHVLRNGVDLNLFSPEERSNARASFNMRRFSLVSVGHLIERKGHDLVVKAISTIQDADLWIAGAGPEEASLRTLAAALGVSNRVRFLGTLPQERLRTLYSGADALVLASSREGWPNVLLEAMACGTPVVATRVWGTPEVVTSPEAGLLVNERTPEGVAEAVMRLRAQMPDRDCTRKYAEQFDWHTTSQGQLEIFSRITASYQSIDERLC